MSEMRMNVKMVTSHQATEFEKSLSVVLEVIEKADGIVFPIQYQFNDTQREYTALVQFQSENAIAFPAKLVQSRQVESGKNPKFFNEDGSRKPEVPGGPAPVVEGKLPPSGADAVLPPATE